MTPISVTLPLFVTPDDSMASTPSQQTVVTGSSTASRVELSSPAVYKGKVKRSWAQLPDSLVRYVVKSRRHPPRSQHKHTD